VPAQRLPHPGLESPRSAGSDDSIDDLLYRKAEALPSADARKSAGQPPIPAAALYQTGGPSSPEEECSADSESDDDPSEGSPVVWPEGKPLPRRLQEKREQQERKAAKKKALEVAKSAVVQEEAAAAAKKKSPPPPPHSVPTTLT
jgi:hypothetical protein